VRLLAWNIRQGGGTRLVGIMAAIARRDADVLILSEYRGGDSAERLCAALKASGYGHVTKLTPPPQRTGVLIAARRRFVERDRYVRRSQSHGAWSTSILACCN
jgi:exonuclease III